MRVKWYGIHAYDNANGAEIHRDSLKVSARKRKVAAQRPKVRR
jgi:hypothetical protein